MLVRVRGGGQAFGLPGLAAQIGDCSDARGADAMGRGIVLAG